MEKAIKDEIVNLKYLQKYNFEKTLPKLIKKLKNKTVVLYGAGAFLEAIKKHYNLCNINVVAVADKRFVGHSSDEKFLDYKAIAPEEIMEQNPDYIIVSTKKYINIIEEIYCKYTKNTKIKIKPLLKKPILTLVEEIWE